MPPQPPRGGPRQRLLPTPRGVNMIVWSLDNRFVLAAIMGKIVWSLNNCFVLAVNMIIWSLDNCFVLAAIMVKIVWLQKCSLR